MEKFVCKIDPKIIYDLNNQISKNRIINWAPDYNDQAGISFDDLSYILDYWKNKFSWTNEEEKLNKFNQYIFFVWQVPPSPGRGHPAGPAHPPAQRPALPRPASHRQGLAAPERRAAAHPHQPARLPSGTIAPSKTKKHIQAGHQDQTYTTHTTRHAQYIPKYT